MNTPVFRALRSGAITLTLIEADDLPVIEDRIRNTAEFEYFSNELRENYLPEYDSDGTRTQYGFYAEIDDQIVGFSLFSVDDWHDMRGSTGADTLPEMRGRGITPGSKAHLFYLGFALLGLNRIETACLISNVSSQRSIEKTLGFEFEGILRGYERNAAGEFEDVRWYGILRRDWERLYNPADVEVIT